MNHVPIIAECSLGSLTVAVAVERWYHIPADSIVVALGPESGLVTRRGRSKGPHFGINHPLARMYGSHLRLITEWPDDYPRAGSGLSPVYEPAESFPEEVRSPSLEAHVVNALDSDATFGALAIVNPPYHRERDSELPGWLRAEFPGEERRSRFIGGHSFPPGAVALADALHKLAGAECGSVLTDGLGHSRRETDETMIGLRLFADTHPDRPLRIVFHRPTSDSVGVVLKSLPLLFMTRPPYR